MLAVSRVAYQTNQTDLLTVIDNQRLLLDAERSFYRALNDLEQARADPERAVGVDIHVNHRSRCSHCRAGRRGGDTAMRAFPRTITFVLLAGCACHRGVHVPWLPG